MLSIQALPLCSVNISEPKVHHALSSPLADPQRLHIYALDGGAEGPYFCFWNVATIICQSQCTVHDAFADGATVTIAATVSARMVFLHVMRSVLGLKRSSIFQVLSESQRAVSSLSRLQHMTPGHLRSNLRTITSRGA